MKLPLATFQETKALDRIKSKLKYPSGPFKMLIAPKLDLKQKQHVETLKRDGYVLMPEFIQPDILECLKNDFENILYSCDFEKPCLAQSKIDPKRHSKIIENNLLLDKNDLIAEGLSINEEDCKSYEHIISEYNPSTLTALMMQRSKNFVSVWLNEFILSIVADYMGMVPQLHEAYVRRNFPCPYKTMNHFWHRDLNDKHFLLKVFFFLSDCNIHTGPHEYIRGSHSDFRLNNQRYFSDKEVDKVYPIESSSRIVSEVKAGTVIIEDTRGLHRAVVPKEGYRDLGYAVFIPGYARRSYYKIPSLSYAELSSFQKSFIPKGNIIN